MTDESVERIRAEAELRQAEAAVLSAEAAQRASRWGAVQALAAALAALIGLGAVLVGVMAVRASQQTSESALRSEEARLFETQRLGGLAALVGAASDYRTELRRGRDRLVQGRLDYPRLDDIRVEQFATFSAALAVARLQDDGRCEAQFMALRRAVNAMDDKALALSDPANRARNATTAQEWDQVGLAVYNAADDVISDCRGRPAGV